jgi:ABC-type branched-subunit amino acid transport system ATPase component
MATELVKCMNLTRYFGPVKALDGVDLTLESGKIVGLLGPNGSGTAYSFSPSFSTASLCSSRLV